MDDFGTFLKKRRVERHLDQVDLSRRLSEKGIPVHNSTISRWEHNKRLPNVDQREALLVIGDVLGMSVDDKNNLLVKADLAPVQPEELDVDHILAGLTKRYKKSHFLHKTMRWSDEQIGRKLDIPFWEVQKDIEVGTQLEKREAPESSLLILMRDVGALAVDPDKGKGGRLVHFTLGNCSDNVITVERICLEVTKCEDNKRRPPVEAKVIPWEYEVELTPYNQSPHEYPFTRDKFRYRGTDADDFELVCRSPGGHKYTARLNVQYTDLATRKAFTAHSDDFNLYFDSKEALDRMFGKAPR